MIFKTSRHRELLLTHRKNTKDEALSAFKLSKAPCVLVSPIVEEGHDFPGDLARFQYLFRVPYVYAKEPLTKARARRDKRYLIDLVAVSLQQTAGRINRSTTDWGYTFISDAHWRHFRMQGAFPGYFRAAWRQLAPGEPIPGPPALHGSVSQRSRAP
jgi:Rad3-related DNA helicase